MADVFRATDGELDRDVAVKVLAERLAGDESLRARFRREALAAARLSGNPNIVTIFDVAELDDRPAIVMEYLPGGTLEERIRRGACPPEQALGWLAETAAALDAAHAAGVVHRDVKPGNLLLDGDGHVHVADFGVASAAGLQSLTQTGTILGTSGYLSPEQACGERATAASDRYALAVVAFELLTGRRPYASESPTAEAAAHVDAEIPSPHELRPSLPPAVDYVFRRALAKDPVARYPTAASFVAGLRAALSAEAVATTDAPTRIVHRRAPVRLRAPLVAAMLVGAGAAAGYVATRGDHRPAARAPQVSVRTVTTPGTTARKPPPPPPAGGSALNDAGYRKQQAGDYAGALPLLEQAVRKLQGTGSTTEAYADYNLAYTRLALGSCTGVLVLLDNSEQIQGHRPEIDRLRREAQRACGGKRGKGGGRQKHGHGGGGD
jgi:hypothetical protein